MPIHRRSTTPPVTKSGFTLHATPAAGNEKPLPPLPQVLPLAHPSVPPSVHWQARPARRLVAPSVASLAVPQLACPALLSSIAGMQRGVLPVYPNGLPQRAAPDYRRSARGEPSRLGTGRRRSTFKRIATTRRAQIRCGEFPSGRRGATSRLVGAAAAAMEVSATRSARPPGSRTSRVARQRSR